VRVDEHTIGLAGAPAYYRSAPASGVPVIYLHGVPTSSDDWIPFLERTGGIAPDLPGFGRSVKAGYLDYSLAGLADFVARLLAELEVHRVRIVGHDWGAAAGLVLAQRHPETIEQLVLCNPLPLLDGFRWPRLARIWRLPVVGELVMGATTRSLLERTLRAGCVRPDAWTASRIDAVWAQFDQGTQRAILRLHRSLDERRLAAAGNALPGLAAPALVVWGERDPWYPSEFAAAYGARLPHATLEQVADAGHWPWLDRPDLIDRIVSFLQGAA
jgi:pimeloyl-ACP methyl ester carboxylesterase